MKYIKELDSLRAIAVILVIINHWIPPTYWINKIPNGAIGVDIFFVLSGFLISKILFDSRNNAEFYNIPKSILVKDFFVRRTLRIFPIYYLTIFILFLFAEKTGTNIQSSFPYFVTYTSNYYFFQTGEWDAALSHLWSLAVEEQFYLIWPWIILFAKKKYFLPIILIFISVGIISQYLMRDIKMNSILTFNCFDAFGLGGILAWTITYKFQKVKILYSIVSIASITSLLFIIIANLLNWTYIPVRIIVSIFTLQVIMYIIIKRETNTLKFKFILSNPTLIFLGKISYGLYLYHNIVPSILNSKIINIYFNPLLPDLLNKQYWGYLYLFENILLLFAMSWLSYTFFEKKFLNLKKYFDYKNKYTLQGQTVQA